MKKIVLFGLGLLSLGALLAGAVAKTDRYGELQIFAKVLNIVEKYYVDPVDTKKLLQGAIQGMLQKLDPHTNYLSPKLYREFESETAGEFGGLGIEITMQGGILTVISPIEDAPAWKAGLKAGDKIVGINGESTKGLSLAEAAQKLRGKRGDKVKLSILREGFDEPKIFVIQRGRVKIQSVKYTDLDSGYAYIRLTSFIENSARDLKKVLETHRKKNKKIRGLILDLRRNPGGLLDQAIQISDMFLDQGAIVSTIGRNKKEKEVIFSKKAGAQIHFPLIVLINEYSASASEILAGALRDNQRALIMGRRSFGKGSVQSVVKLGDGSGLKMTVARYYTPSGTSIQAQGIQPDIVLEDVDLENFEKAVIKKPTRRERDIKGHLEAQGNSKAGESQPAATGEENRGEKRGEKRNRGEKSRDQSQGASPEKFLDRSSPFLRVRALKKSGKKLSRAENLLAGDYQVFQAFEYLKAISTAHGFWQRDRRKE